MSFFKILLNGSSKLWALSQALGSKSICLNPLLTMRLIDYNNCNDKTLKTVSMNKDLGYKQTFVINILKFFRSNVFSLCQLKNILLSINDFKSSIG